jgi:hypothetical protein
MDDIADVIIVLDEEVAIRKSTLSKTETDVMRMFLLAGLHPYTWKPIKYGVPAFVNACLVIGSLAPLWYPDYYLHQTEIWTAHLVLAIPCYNYILVQRHQWPSVSFHEHTEIRPLYRRITLGFYVLFMVYYAYFAAYMIYANSHRPWPFQIGNIVMGFSWYFFFAISSATYYCTATTFLQKALFVKKKIKALKVSNNLLLDFYTMYDAQFRSLRRYNNVWNRIIFIVLVVLIANIPIDAIAVVVKKAYFDAPGIVIKCFAVLWYLVTICKLNHMEHYTVTYLRKHHWLEENMEAIEQYIQIRPIGLNFFGIKITFEYLAKLLVLAVNLLIPTAYGLIKNNVL